MTVTGVDDNIIDGTITSTITIAVVDASSDNDFDAVDDQTVSATTTDNDVAGFTIIKPVDQPAWRKWNHRHLHRCPDAQPASMLS